MQRFHFVSLNAKAKLTPYPMIPIHQLEHDF